MTFSGSNHSYRGIRPNLTSKESNRSSINASGNLEDIVGWGQHDHNCTVLNWAVCKYVNVPEY